MGAGVGAGAGAIWSGCHLEWVPFGAGAGLDVGLDVGLGVGLDVDVGLDVGLDARLHSTFSFDVYIIGQQDVGFL